ncbi:hypothetical protein EFW59_04229 [Bacillus subtilis]|uniref:hypothetical protein n=1 Tax=Bacillus subtilis TaxID=1423 RepID=UPI000F8DCF10|nr:hypothetical protein [Bacillus subtilis]RUS03632.1 hypothetical protein EFW59_04229 [Bacillus subtilis]
MNNSYLSEREVFEKEMEKVSELILKGDDINAEKKLANLCNQIFKPSPSRTPTERSAVFLFISVVFALTKLKQAPVNVNTILEYISLLTIRINDKSYKELRELCEQDAVAFINYQRTGLDRCQFDEQFEDLEGLYNSLKNMILYSPYYFLCNDFANKLKGMIIEEGTEIRHKSYIPNNEALTESLILLDNDGLTVPNVKGKTETTRNGHQVMIKQNINDEEPSFIKAIKLSRVLGEIRVLKKNKGFKSTLLTLDFCLFRFIKEILSWKEAKKIYKDEDQGMDYLFRHYQWESIVSIMRESSVGLIKDLIIRPAAFVFKLVQLYVFTYLFIASVYILNKNKIPIPDFLHWDVTLVNFVPIVNSMFIYLSVLFIFMRIFKWSVWGLKPSVVEQKSSNAPSEVIEYKLNLKRK